VFEVSLVVGAGREKHGTGIFTVGKYQLPGGLSIGLEKACQAPHLGCAKHIRDHAGGYQTIFECVSGAGRGMCAVCQCPPVAIRRAG